MSSLEISSKVKELRELRRMAEELEAEITALEEKVAIALESKVETLFKSSREDARLSAKYVYEHHAFIHMVLQQAVREQLIPSNAADRATPPKKDKKEAEFLEPEEIAAIIDSLESEPLIWRAIIHLLIATGARRGEIVGLKWNSVDWNNNTIHICNNLQYAPDKGIWDETPKTGDTRFVSVAPEALAILQQWKQEQKSQRLVMGAQWQNTGYCFTQMNGQPIFPDSVTAWLGKFSERHNLPHISPHMFRHSQAAILIDSGVDITTVSKRLGHKRVSTTADVYSHMLGKADAKASEAVASVVYNRKSAQKTG